MSLPQKTQKKYGDRFKHLIAEGEAIKSNIKIVPGGYAVDPYDILGSHHAIPDVTIMDLARLTQWRTNCISLLNHIVPRPSPLDCGLEIFQRDARQWAPSCVESAISILKGIHDDFERGFLDDVATAIEAEIAADYMGQAESLLGEGQTGKYDHVPSAVLAAAVLEKGLRTLCVRQQPPIPMTNPRGEPKTLNPLIDDLKKSGTFNELKAKQLRAWADIRNKAAHGEFDQFNRSDVEMMLQGINTFLADFL